MNNKIKKLIKWSAVRSYVLNKNKVLIITPSAQITEQIEEDMSVLGKTFYEKIDFEKEETQNFIEDNLIILTPKIWKKWRKEIVLFPTPQT